MHRDILRLQFKAEIENLPPPWKNAIHFGYIAIFSNLRFLRRKTLLTSDITSKFGYSVLGQVTLVFEPLRPP